MKSTRAAYQLFHDGQLALSVASANGIRIDSARLDKAITDTTTRIEELETALVSDPVAEVWKKTYGDKMNFGSSQQLGDIVFDRLHFSSQGRTATGKHKTDEAALEKVDSPFVKLWLKIRELKKVRSTSLEGIRRELVDGYIHPFFRLNTARTLRSSSSDPNFQNFPVRDPEYAELVRSCFIPRNGHVLVENDFTGAEVRVGACYHQDPSLIAYVNDPTKDMHRDAAGELFLLEEHEITKQVRYAAKSFFVFAEFYGDWYIHCAQNLWEAIAKLNLKTASGTPLYDHLKTKGITRLGTLDPQREPAPDTFEKRVRDAERLLWGKRFPVYAAWKRSWYEDYLATGGFMLLTGFYVEGVYSRNDVVNYPIQGSSFHCLLWCLIELQKWLTKNKMQAKIVGQIHDSIVADVPVTELQDYLNAVQWIVSVGLPKAWPWLIVPMEIEAEVCPEGGSWYGKKEWLNKAGAWVPKDTVVVEKPRGEAMTKPVPLRKLDGPTEIVLTKHDVQRAKEVGKARNNGAQRYGATDEKHARKATDLEIHYLGAYGQLAFANYLEIPWRPKVNCYGNKDGNVGPYWVVTRSNEFHDLIVRPGGDDDKIFVLVTAAGFPTMKIWGWLRGQEAKQKKWLKVYGGGSPAYFVPKEELHPVQTLPFLPLPEDL